MTNLNITNAIGSYDWMWDNSDAQNTLREMGAEAYISEYFANTDWANFAPEFEGSSSELHAQIVEENLKAAIAEAAAWLEANSPQEPVLYEITPDAPFYAYEPVTREEIEGLISELTDEDGGKWLPAWDVELADRGDELRIYIDLIPDPDEYDWDNAPSFSLNNWVTITNTRYYLTVARRIS